MTVLGRPDVADLADWEFLRRRVVSPGLSRTDQSAGHILAAKKVRPIVAAKCEVSCCASPASLL